MPVARIGISTRIEEDLYSLDVAPPRSKQQNRIAAFVLSFGIGTCFQTRSSSQLYDPVRP